MAGLNLDAIVETSAEPSAEERVKVSHQVDKYFGAEIRRFEETTDLRSLLAKVFTMIIAFWLLGVLLILVGNNFRYRLSDTVLNTLLTTTTIQVLGMMLIILWDLFPGGKNQANKSTQKKPVSTGVAKKRKKAVSNSPE